jgi:hypothetical protein
MTAITSGSAASGEGPAVLAAQLRYLAATADEAGRQAEGSYLLTGNRADELRTADHAASVVIQQLRELMPRIAQDGGEHDGVVIAQRAVRDLVDGRDSLRRGSGAAEELAAGTAGSLFRHAAAGARAVAEIAEFRSLSPADVDEAARLLAYVEPG